MDKLRVMRVSDAHPVILAGGFGTRLRRVMGNQPKPMALVHGRPFIEWVVCWLRSAGCGVATVSTGYLGEVIEAHFAAHPLTRIEVCCRREAAPLGTAGALLYSARESGCAPGVWVVLNGDSLICIDLAQTLRRFEDDGADAAIIARRVKSPGRYGVLGVGTDRRLRSFSEKAAVDTEPALINAGIYFFRPGLLDRFPDSVPLSFELDVFPAWLRSDVSIAVLDCDAPFLDIGTEESLALADRFIDDNRDAFP
jgi:D-glycero-alpha-D-manno-heptose 1-phosphate guanylyltransferase